MVGPPPDEDESAGSAQAAVAPLRVTANPIPRATASPPTRPTYADACISNVPPSEARSINCPPTKLWGGDFPHEEIRRAARPRIKCCR